jgi:outer membrane protein assembly factor BamB
VDTSGNTGQLRWSFKTGGSVISNPVIGEDGTVYVFAGDYTLYAISPPTTGTTGVLKWSLCSRNLARPARLEEPR